MKHESLDDRLDRLVAEYSDRVAGGGAPTDSDLLDQVPEEHREALERCFRMIRAGLSEAPSALRPLAPGVRLGGFTLIAEIGRGGMAHVWRARQEDLEREVALKILRPGLAIEGRHVDRFKREALAVARLQHPHIVSVFDVGEDRGYHFLAMELIDGPHLGQVLEAMPESGTWTAEHLRGAAGLPDLAPGRGRYEEALAALLAPVARAIGVAHEIGIVHRDIKPSNILIHRDGRALIADFGLAKGPGDPALSLTGEPLGTPYYMSPEQAAASTSPVDERSDVYGLGVTLYEAFSGRRPFEGKTVFDVLDRIRNGLAEPLRPRGEGSTRNACSVVERAMERRPEDRYARALDLATDLAAVAEGQPTTALARRGGPVRGVLRALREAFSGQRSEYRSTRTFMGWPLVHIRMGPRRPGERIRRAHGWIAMGDVATGGLCFGGMAAGLIGSFGGLSLGGIAIGGMALGGIALGGGAVGGIAHGGGSAGYSATGGIAVGHYAIGGVAVATHGIDGSGRDDPEAREWFESVRGVDPVVHWYLKMDELKDNRTWASEE